MGFNGAPFNTIRQAVFYMELAASGAGEFTAAVTGSMGLRLDIEGQSDAVASFIRMLSTGEVDFETFSQLDIPAIRIQYTAAGFDGAGEMELSPGTYEAFTFLAGLAPGDTLEIDTEKFQIVKNGQPVLEGYEGKFVDILPGLASIIYKDDVSRRTLQLTVQFVERYL